MGVKNVPNYTVPVCLTQKHLSIKRVLSEFSLCMFDTKTFINKTSFIRIFIGIKVIRYYLAVVNFVTLTTFSHAGLLSANMQSLTCCFGL